MSLAAPLSKIDNPTQQCVRVRKRMEKIRSVSALLFKSALNGLIKFPQLRSSYFCNFSPAPRVCAARFKVETNRRLRAFLSLIHFLRTLRRRVRSIKLHT